MGVWMGGSGVHGAGAVGFEWLRWARLQITPEGPGDL